MALGILLFAASLLPAFAPLETTGFERIAARNGVVAYKHVDPHVIHVAVEGVFEVPPEAVRRAVLDYARQVGHLDRLAEARVLDRGTSCLVVYQRLDLPIISDRDYSLFVRWGKDDDVLWVTHQAAARTGPRPRPGIVRVSEHAGSWRLHPLRGGAATFARFETTIDLSGRLPTWLARSAAGKELPAMFEAMRELTVQTTTAGGQR